VSNLDANLDRYVGLFFVMTEVSFQDEVLSYFFTIFVVSKVSYFIRIVQ
jgi:hypothetical protein